MHATPLLLLAAHPIVYVNASLNAAATMLLLLGWSEVRIASGASALFIWCVSIAGLLGNFSSVRALPSELPLYVGVVLAGALIGTTLGTGRLSVSGVLKALGLVLIVAGFKLVGFY